jgi:DNA-binding beta-propeller fold protein YncE
MTFTNGYLYLAAWHEGRIKRVSLSDMMMENVAGRASRAHYDGDEGPAMMAGVDLPSSVTFDPQGNLVFMDQGNLVVRMVDSAQTIHTIAGKCVIEATPCSDTVLPTPCPGSNKFVCGDPAACIDTASGPAPGTALCTQTSSGDGGPAIDARFNMPFTQFADPAGRITYDHAGDLIIPETGGNRIRKVDHVTGMIHTIAGTGVAGFAGDGGPATAAQINHPVDIAIADDNSIYFSDVWNHCIRKIDTAGMISTVAGACHYTPEGDPGEFSGDGGPPLEAQLYKPYGIDLVGTKLYVSDSYNNRLRVVNLLAQ